MHILTWLDKTKKIAYPLLIFILITPFVNVTVLVYDYDPDILSAIAGAIICTVGISTTIIFIVVGRRVIARVKQMKTVDERRIWRMTRHLILSCLGTVMNMVAIAISATRTTIFLPAGSIMTWALWTFGNLITSAAQICAYHP